MRFAQSPSRSLPLLFALAFMTPFLIALRVSVVCGVLVRRTRSRFVGFSHSYDLVSLDDCDPHQADAYTAWDRAWRTGSLCNDRRADWTAEPTGFDAVAAGAFEERGASDNLSRRSCGVSMSFVHLDGRDPLRRWNRGSATSATYSKRRNRARSQFWGDRASRLLILSFGINLGYCRGRGGLFRTSEAPCTCSAGDRTKFTVSVDIGLEHSAHPTLATSYANGTASLGRPESR